MMDNAAAPRAKAEERSQHADVLDIAVSCPFCHSTETELLSLFGSQLSTTQYYCRTCRTPFEYIKQNPQPER